jgi:hypothetical protein
VIAGIDYSTRAVDIVLLDEDTDAATWHRFELKALGKRDDAFERTRSVRDAMPSRSSGFWDDVMSAGIEQPRGNYGVYDGMRVQGAILACLPARLQVQPHNPAEWRKTVGLPGNASKFEVLKRAYEHLSPTTDELIDWPQDACDAYCIALATRTLLERVAA